MTRLVVGVLVAWFLVAGVGVEVLQAVPGAVGTMAASLTAALPTAAAPTAPPTASTESDTSGPTAAHDREIACWLYEGGWAPANIPTATAISYPESSGSPASIQEDQPYATTGWGLMQITPGDSVPQVGTNDALLNPVTNARAALVKFDSAGGFTPWSTFTEGQYLTYLPGVESALAGFDYGAC